MKALRRAWALAGLAGALLMASFGAGAALTAAPAGDAKTIRIGYLAREEPARIPLTFLEPDI